MALCPVCKTECGDNAVCPKCGFFEVGRTFINREEAELWRETVVMSYRNKYIANSSFCKNAVIKGTELVEYIDKEAENVVIPYGITHIGYNAFADCSELTSITIPDSVVSIDEAAFFKCESLEEITIPDKVTHIDDYAFSGCYSLQYINIPQSVTEIGEGVFEYCDHLTTIDVDSQNCSYSSCDGVLFDKEKDELIQYPGGNKREFYSVPPTVTAIGHRAFFESYSLQRVVIREEVSYVDEEAFERCGDFDCLIFICQKERDVRMHWDYNWDHGFDGYVFFEDMWHYDENGEPMPDEELT